MPRHSYYLRPDGSKSYLSAHLSPLLSETGDYLGKVVVFRDISRIIEAEKTIKNERNNLKMMFNLLPTSMLVIDDEMLINRVKSCLSENLRTRRKGCDWQGFWGTPWAVFSTPMGAVVTP